MQPKLDIFFGRSHLKQPYSFFLWWPPTCTSKGSPQNPLILQLQPSTAKKNSLDCSATQSRHQVRGEKMGAINQSTGNTMGCFKKYITFITQRQAFKFLVQLIFWFVESSRSYLRLKELWLVSEKEEMVQLFQRKTETIFFDNP